MNDSTSEVKIPHSQGIDLDVIQKRLLLDNNAAQILFAKACGRLLDINGWNELNAVKEYQYQLFNGKGEAKEGKAAEDDFIRFNLPVPSSKVGEGYDWVRIIRIQEANAPGKNTLILHVRPTADPTVADNSTAHFYSSKTTNTFMIERNGRMVTVGIHPRNEILNTEEVHGWYNKLRNTLIGFMAWLGVSKSQWKSLATALLKD